MLPDVLVRCLYQEGVARVVGVTTTETSREAARRQGVAGPPAVALSRAATCSLLLATLTKGKERVTVQIEGDGPLSGVTADAYGSGEVRVYTKNPDLRLETPAGRVALRDVVGRRGVVNVVRDLGLKERYAGQVEIITGEIDEDIEYYLRSSEQIDSALGAEAVLSPDGAIVGAAGVLVQSMPGGEGAELVRTVQHRLRTGELHREIEIRTRDGRVDPADLCRALVHPDLRVLESQPVRFACPCSLDRVTAMLRTLSDEELEAMIREDGMAEVTCNFCREVYRLSGPELEQLRQERN